jgi:hypothetical protein
MVRLTLIGTAAVAVAALAAPAFAQSQADIASRLNDEGKEQMYTSNYAQAADKFREAVARVPEAKYFFNLCTAQYQLGKFGEALTACEAVAQNHPTAELQDKATKMIGKIKAEAQTQGLKVSEEGGGGIVDCNANPNACPAKPDTCQSNPGAPECQPQVRQAPPPIVGRPPTGGALFQTITPDNKYVWTLGAEIVFGGGSMGQKDAYGTTAVGVRFKGDFLFNPAKRMGSELYMAFAKTSEGVPESFGGTTGVDPGATLSMFDFGLGIYKHMCPSGPQRLCITPLIGAHLSLMSPDINGTSADGSQFFNYVSAGARAEVSLQYAFGPRFEHVFNVSLGANLYSSVFAGPSADNLDCGGEHCATAQEAGLDKGGAIGYLSIGYTHRFRTPLGASPFVTLE